MLTTICSEDVSHHGIVIHEFAINSNANAPKYQYLDKKKKKVIEHIGNTINLFVFFFKKHRKVKINAEYNISTVHANFRS